MLRLTLVFCTASFLTGGLTQPTAAQADPPLTWRTGEIRSVMSEAVEGMEYKIVVTLPSDYAASSDQYPVLYYLDAWYMAGGIEETYRWIRAFDDIPPLILVGVSWEADGAQSLYFRARDYIPTEISPDSLPPGLAAVTPASGGAPEFLRFITDELIPFIEREYRADPQDRGLFGYSHGGLFASWVLFNTDGLFQRYLIGSPTIMWDDYVVLDHEAALAERTAFLPARVFLSIGSEEPQVGFNRLKDRLESRAYDGLQLTTMVFDGENHTSAIPATYSRAFRVLYGRER